MGIIFSHIARLVVDLILLGIMYYLEIYEFSSTIIFLIIIRLIVGHAGRIFQYMFGSLDDMDGLIAGFVANGIKTILESIILFNIYSDISAGIAIAIVVCILLRNSFEAISLCEEFGE